MKNVIIFSLEPIESRYTIEWYNHLPKLLRDHFPEEVNIIQIDGKTNSGVPTDGAFLDFLSTNQWKNEQVNTFFELVKDGGIKKGDHIIFTDFWNPTITQVKYVNDLMGMNWTTHALIHAGSYDPQDFLGRIIGNQPWVRTAEESFFHSYDFVYFATDFHIDLFGETYPALYTSDKIVKTGWPMEYMDEYLTPYKGMEKKNTIVFPHRIAPEKQVEIFRDLAIHLPEYEFIVCQDQKLTKQEYHTILGEAKMVFSCSLQETLGIGCYEGLLVDALPFVPDRLSYKEMYLDTFKYKPEFTESWDSYCANRESLVHTIKIMMDGYDYWKSKVLTKQVTKTKKFFTATALLNNIKDK